MIDADFRLGTFTLTLLYDHVERNGIQIQMTEFGINFKKYDNEKGRNPFAHELHARNKLFRISSINSNKKADVILEQIEDANAGNASSFEESKDD